MAPIPVGEVPPGQSLAYYQQLFASKYGAAAGNAYVAYFNAHPGLTPEQAAKQYLEIILVHGLDAALSAGLGGAGSAAGQVPAAAAKGAQNAYNTLTAPLKGIEAIGAFFNKLGDRNLWIRVGKVVIGGLLLVIGLVHITGAGGAVAGLARKVPLPV